jgi:nicotinate phosphoribosyltransferase
MEPIIESLLDTDLYKLTMHQAVLHQFPSVDARFKFKCRNKGVKFTKEQFYEIGRQVNHLCSLYFTEDELAYLRTIYFLKPDYIDFLRLFKMDRKYIDISWMDGELIIRISGPWLYTILFETPVLAIVNEVYFWDENKLVNDLIEGSKKLSDKIDIIKQLNDPNFKFSEFGARRRYGMRWHDTVVKSLATLVPQNFVGTSDVCFAYKHNVKAIGTMAHEWIQAGQALTNLRNSQKFMLQKWADEYRGELGIALSDTLGIDVFLRDFDSYFAKLFDGVRHDSGDPIEMGEKVIAHYEKLKIDPMTKSIVFSDSLTIPRAIEIYKHFKGRIKVSFGIGTNLTNDLVREPLNIVIKMTHCNGQPVAKISDNNGKGMCEDEDYLKMLKGVLKRG